MKNILLLILFVFISLPSLAQKKVSPSKDYLITLSTEFGNMYLILYDETPLHKANFVKLAEQAFYNDLLFHRVINEFMIQGGDPKSKTAKEGEQLGDGDLGYTIPAEFNEKIFHKKGVIAAARDNNPAKASSACQFYIVQGKRFTDEDLAKAELRLEKAAKNDLFAAWSKKPENKALQDSIQIYQQSGNQIKLNELLSRVEKDINAELEKKGAHKIPEDQRIVYKTIGGTPHLDQNYTAFGEVIQGLEVIDKIAAQATDKNNRPLKDIKMKVDIKLLPKKAITKMYGYQYK